MQKGIKEGEGILSLHQHPPGNFDAYDESESAYRYSRQVSWGRGGGAAWLADGLGEEIAFGFLTLKLHVFFLLSLRQFRVDLGGDQLNDMWMDIVYFIYWPSLCIYQGRRIYDKVFIQPFLSALSLDIDTCEWVHPW